jgi:gluconate 2-dehydrogenase gamma chain
MTISRRNALRIIGAVPAAAGLTWTEAEAQQAHQQATTARAATAAKGKAYKPKFFSAHEWATIAVLVDIVIPKDERSVSASEAGVPEFMDFMMTDRPAMQTPMRGGLRWLDHECIERFDKTFLASTPAERTAVLDDIAYPAKATPALSHGIAFFSAFRDLTATGFWTSKAGIADLQYIGNAPTTWNGCPDACLEKIGVKS